MRTLFTSLRARLSWALLAIAAALVSCGGGGESAATVKFTSVAMAGELLDYTLDPVNLTYSSVVSGSFEVSRPQSQC